MVTIPCVHACDKCTQHFSVRHMPKMLYLFMHACICLSFLIFIVRVPGHFEERGGGGKNLPYHVTRGGSLVAQGLWDYAFFRYAFVQVSAKRDHGRVPLFFVFSSLHARLLRLPPPHATCPFSFSSKVGVPAISTFIIIIIYIY